MNNTAQLKPHGRTAAILDIERSGRNWAAIRDSLDFQKPAPLFDQPMQISLAMIRGLRMVEEPAEEQP